MIYLEKSSKDHKIIRKKNPQKNRNLRFFKNTRNSS